MVNASCQVSTEIGAVCGCCGDPVTVPIIWADDKKGVCYDCYTSAYDVCFHCGRLLPTQELVDDGYGECSCSECMETVKLEKELGGCLSV